MGKQLGDVSRQQSKLKIEIFFIQGHGLSLRKRTVQFTLYEKLEIHQSMHTVQCTLYTVHSKQYLCTVHQKTLERHIELNLISVYMNVQNVHKHT